MTVVEVLFLFLLVYIAIGVTMVYYKKDVRKTGQTFVRPIIEREKDGDVSRIAAGTSRVIPLTDEYEYEQSKKFKNIADR